MKLLRIVFARMMGEVYYLCVGCNGWLGSGHWSDDSVPGKIRSKYDNKCPKCGKQLLDKPVKQR